MTISTLAGAPIVFQVPSEKEREADRDTVRAEELGLDWDDDYE